MPEPLTITLSPELSEKVRAQAAHDGFTNVAEFIENSVAEAIASDVRFEVWLAEDATIVSDEFDSEEPDETLGRGEEAFNDWLRKEAVPVLEAMKQDPSRGRTMEQVRDRLAEEHAKFQRAS